MNRHHEANEGRGSTRPAAKQYGRFGAMVVTSAVLMYAATYLNSFRWDHVFFSETRIYMALVMAALMAVVMLSFMLRMHRNRRVNAAIYAGAALVFFIGLWLARSQRTIQDVSYMRAMIPHHSIAILTSERARISDPRVRKLADEIIASQQREISEMKVLIEDIEANGEGSQPVDGATQILLAPQVPAPDPALAKVPDGFRVEVVLTGLTYPTSVEFDDEGAMYVAESGYSYGDSSPAPRILRVSAEGNVMTVAQGASLVGPVNDLLWHQGQLYIAHRGKVSSLDENGRVRDLLTGLPSQGDHHNNQMTTGPDGKLYFGQGTLTNSGVVGVDSYEMGWLKEHPTLHDIPARDVTLAGIAFETPNPLNSKGEKVETSAFHPFGEAVAGVSTVEGQTKASGTILRMNPDGSELEVYAWGLRNPYGVMWGPDETLYATENGFDDRGSRPIANDQEDIYVIKEGAWYGWPDFAMGLPVTNERFKPKGQAQPQFVMENHPSVEQPWLGFPEHSAIAKLDFATTEEFGKGRMFVAFFGHMSPMTGEAPEEHGGHRVVRIDLATKNVDTFFSKMESTELHGHGAHQGGAESGSHVASDPGAEGQVHEESMTAGPRRLLDVRFAPDGKALYVADFGAMIVGDKPRPVPRTGVIWRITPEDSRVSGPPANLTGPR